MPSFVTTMPDYDDATYYLRKWTSEIIEEAKSKNFLTSPLHEKQATRELFESSISRSKKPIFVLINGHGSEMEIFGHGNITRDATTGQMMSDEIILQVGVNESITSGCIVYARACYSSSQLSEGCRKNGANAYIGYKKRFLFLADPNLVSRPESDKVANYFKTVSNVIALTIIKGHSAKEAIDRSRQATKKIMAHLEASEFNTDEAQSILPFLLHDVFVLDLTGNPDAKI